MHRALIEDDDEQRALLELRLSADGRNTVASFATVASLRQALAVGRFDVLIHDWFLRDATGADVLGWVRRHLGGALPLIVVTAREDEATVVSPLAAGADDCVVKSSNPSELLARVAAVVRRTDPTGMPVLHLGVYEVDILQHRVFVENVPVATTKKKFNLVDVFQNPRKLFSRYHLLDKIWAIFLQHSELTLCRIFVARCEILAAPSCRLGHSENRG